MNIDDQTSTILGEFDLNEYETRSYLAILEGGVVVAREVSDRAEIPYAKVYQTLNSLISKLLIIGDEGRPKKFQARPPEQAFNDLLDSMERRWEEELTRKQNLKEKILPDLIQLYNLSDVDAEEEQGIWNVVGISNIQSRLSRIVSSTQSRIIVATGDPSIFTSYLQQILKGNDLDYILVSSIKAEDTHFTSYIIESDLGNATEIYFDSSIKVTIISTQKGKFGSVEYSAIITKLQQVVSSDLIRLKTISGGVL